MEKATDKVSDGNGMSAGTMDLSLRGCLWNRLQYTFLVGMLQVCWYTICYLHPCTQEKLHWFIGTAHFLKRGLLCNQFQGMAKITKVQAKVPNIYLLTLVPVNRSTPWQDQTFLSKWKHFRPRSKDTRITRFDSHGSRTPCSNHFGISQLWCWGNQHLGGFINAGPSLWLAQVEVLRFYDFSYL